MNHATEGQAPDDAPLFNARGILRLTAFVSVLAAYGYWGSHLKSDAVRFSGKPAPENIETWQVTKKWTTGSGRGLRRFVEIAFREEHETTKGHVVLFDQAYIGMPIGRTRERGVMQEIAKDGTMLWPYEFKSRLGLFAAAPFVTILLIGGWVKRRSIDWKGPPVPDLRR